MDVVINPSPTGSGIKPEMPLEPPKEAKEMKFEMPEGGMSSLFGDGTTLKTDKINDIKVEPAPIKQEEVKPVEAGKEEAKPKQEEQPKLEKPVKEEQPSPKKEEKITPKVEDQGAKSQVKKEIKPISPIKDKKEAPDEFDYSKYSPAHVENMKNMSRQARAEFARILDENKQLSTLKDSTYLQHENAYVLSPEYNELQTKHNLAAIEGRCWEQSLISLKKTGKFKEIIGWNKDGSPAFSTEKDATDADEIRLQNNVTLCTQAAGKLSGELQAYPNQFKTRITSDLSAIEQERNARFAWVSDKKILDAPVELEDGTTQTVSTIKNNFKSLFPAYLQNNPGVEVASDLMVALMIRSAELREASVGKTVAQIKQNEASRGEPTSEERENNSTGTSSNGKGVPKIFSMDGMPTR